MHLLVHIALCSFAIEIMENAEIRNANTFTMSFFFSFFLFPDPITCVQI